VFLTAVWAVPPAAQSAPSIGPAVLAFGDASAPGDPAALRPHRPVVGMAAAPGGGYWLVAADGGIFAFGSAAYKGSMGGVPLNRPIVGMAATPDGGGYWLVASDGGIFAFGNARFFGSTGGMPLNRPIVGMAATPDGGGYWLVASDGGVFAFGSAMFRGSTGGIALNKPVVGMAAAPDGNGYWLVATDGGVFAFGAPFRGSTGSIKLNRPIVGMAAAAGGYWMVASDGGMFAFNAGFFGSGVGKLGAGRVATGMARSATGNGYTILAVPATMRIGFAGDTHGVSRVGAYLASGGNPLAPMAPFFASNDVNIVNLETAVGSSGSPAVKQYTFQSPPSLLAALRAGGTHVVNLGNNHSLDYGPGALLETIELSRAHGLATVGAGRDAAEAFAPAVLSTPGGTVAVIGLSQVVPPGWAAGPGRPGVANAYDTTAVSNAVRSARAAADHVVVMVHWGDENADCPNGKQTGLASLLLQAGADAVVGNHPHRLQGITAGGGKLVGYSVGNFIWYNHSPPNDLTGLLSVELDSAGVRSHDFVPARIDGNGRPVPLTGAAAADALARLASLAPGGGRC
jgi:Bacterial capsule synthesis protein PGA_cap